MIVIGLTGSIGMGKSTTAAMFEALAVPVFDCDAAVHDFYKTDAVPLIETAFPETVKDGMVNRAALSAKLMPEPNRFSELEAIIHPLVHQREQAFIAQAKSRNKPLVLIDSPLLFETGGQDRVDVSVVTSCSEEIQRARVLARPGMTEDKFNSILARQMPDAQKRDRADYIIDTGHGLETAKQQVSAIVTKLLDHVASS